jgi:hypothetical protein
MKLRPFSFFIVFIIAISCALLGMEPNSGERPRGRNGWKQDARWARPRGLSQRADTASSDVQKQRARVAYGQLPIFFERNVGQTNRAVKFLARGSGYNFFLTAAEAVVVARNAEKSAVVRMKLAGANASPRITGVEQLAGKTNYFIGKDPAKWRTNVPTFGKVKYTGVYPGIDLLYYGTREKLEYDFVVAPGQDPRAIHIRISGAQATKVDGAGDLVLTTEAGNVKLAKPVVYQEAKGERREVAGRFELSDGDLLGFTVGGYDKALPLIIDPTLVYSTYLGGTGALGDQAYAIAVDSAGEAYVTGQTGSTDFPTAASPFQSALPGLRNAFVTKFSSTGASLVYSTFLGGSNTDLPNGIALDSKGEAYVTGATSSTNFPLMNAFQSSLTSIQNAFVTKLSSTGSALVFSTYLGGNSQDFGHAIAVDAAGNAYVAGDTMSTNFPVTSSVFQSTLAGFTNAFAAKFSPAGALTWATYLGGNSGDSGKAIAVDGTGNVYVTGITSSSRFPVMNAIQSSLMAVSPGSNAFISELNPTATGLVFSTFLGGSTNIGNGDRGTGIAVDSLGNIIVAGVALSSDFPLVGSFQAHDPSVDDLFVAKLTPPTPGPSSLVFSTLFGDQSGDTEANAVALDSAGNIYLTGDTSALFLPTRDPLQSTTQAGTTSDSASAFVVEIKSDGSDYLFSTFLGGSQSTLSPTFFQDFGTGIAVDTSGNIYVAGTATTTDFPTDAFQATLKSANGNGFVTKISPATPTGPQVFPASLDLGNSPVGSASLPEIVTVANGTNPLTFTTIAIIGPNASDFMEEDSCIPQLLPQVVCTVAVTATPTVTGTRTATLQINDSDPSSPQTVSLKVTGTGVTLPPPPPPAGTVTVSPTPNLPAFPATEVTTTNTTTQNVTVMNTGTVAVSMVGAFSGANLVTLV